MTTEPCERCHGMGTIRCYQDQRIEECHDCNGWGQLAVCRCGALMLVTDDWCTACDANCTAEEDDA